jgi:quinol monooxygenase YgiN
MLLIVGTFSIPPENLSSARPVMERMVQNSRAEDGCEAYFYAEDLFTRGLIHVKEQWRNQLALDRHFASNHLAAWRSSWAEFGIGSRNLQAYDVDGSREI